MEDVKIIEVEGHDQSEDYSIKFVIVGDSGVGKTNILNRYVRNSFYLDGKSTIGIELETKMFKIQDKLIKLNIWDTAGQERFKSVTQAYYKGAKGAIMVYDITRENTFNNIDNWFREIKDSAMSDMNLILIGNKSDLEEHRKVSTKSGIEKASNLGVAFMETSAKDNINVAEAFKIIINKTYINSILKDIVKKQPEKIEKIEGIKIHDKVYKEESPDVKKKCC